MKRNIIIVIAIFLIGCAGGGGEYGDDPHEDGGSYCAGGTASLLKAHGDIDEAKDIFKEYLSAFQPVESLGAALKIVHDGDRNYCLKNAYSIAQADCLINKGYWIAIHILTKPLDHWMYVDDIYPNDPKIGGYKIICIESEKNTLGEIIEFNAKENADLVDVITSGGYAGTEINYFIGYREKG